MKMTIQVANLPHPALQDEINSDCIAIVIDTLRFTTTACQALAAGAAAIHTSAEIDELTRLAAQQAGPVLLCGERECRPIEGFQLGNSPLEYQAFMVASKALFFTTTNGTRAIASARNAGSIWLSAFVNRAATCRALLKAGGEQVWIVCAGTDGSLALEDVLAAGAIIELAMKDLEARPSGDAAWLALHAWNNVLQAAGGWRHESPGELDPQPQVPGLTEAMAVSSGGRNLIQAGYDSDLEFAAQLDVLDKVPRSHPGTWNEFH